MRFFSIRSLLSVAAFLFLLISCGEEKKEDVEQSQIESYDSLNASITIVKSYVRKLDSALLETSKLEALLNNSDSAKSALRSRDRDAVRMYEIEKIPLVDTLSEDYNNRVVIEANKVLEEANYAIENTREEIETKKLQYAQGEIDPEREITQEFQALMKDYEKIITEADNEVKNLQKKIDKVVKSN